MPLSQLAPALLVIIAGLTVGLLQQLPANWLEPVLGRAPRIWNEAAVLLQRPVTARGTIDPERALGLAGPAMLALLGFVAGYLAADRRETAILLMRTIACIITVYALYAVIAFLLWPDHVLWRRKSAHLGDLTGTFLNRNTAGAYFGAGSVLWLLAGLHALRKRAGIGASIQRASASFGAMRSLTGRLWLETAGFMICFLAVLLSHSRAGTMLTALTCMAAGGLYIARGRAVAHGRHARFARIGGIALLAALIVGLLELGGSGLEQRLAALGLGDIARASTYQSAIGIIRDNPILGTGFGTFPLVFPAYRDPAASTVGLWDRAHNGLIEIAVEGGLPLAILIVSATALVLFRLARGVAWRVSNPLPLAAVAILCQMLAHSMVDYPLQIPAVLLTVAIVTGAGLRQSERAMPAS